jgi:hypothetical protein
MRSIRWAVPLVASLGIPAAMVAAVFVDEGAAQAASSPNVVGQKYGDAASALSGAGYTVVVSTTVGDRQAWPACVVVNQQVRTVSAPENTGGSATNQMLVSLNCDAPVASATSPGNSLASPAGRAAAASAAASASATPAAAPSG